MGGGLSTPSTSSYRFGVTNDVADADDLTDDSSTCSWVGSTLELPSTPFSVDAHFHLRGVLGTGMLGRVRLVQHTKSKTFFALKSMHKSDIQAQHMARHVDMERAALAKLAPLRHPFLASFFGSFQTASHVHLVLEYVPGGELLHRLHQVGGTFSPETTKFYAAELALFVGFCHRHGYMYRDLKPENVLLDARGHIKVVDLGFIRRFDDRHERCSTSVGTPQYLAPEQLTQSKAKRSYTCIVDWWALACMVFEMATGRTPFASSCSTGTSSSESPFEVYTRIVQGRIQWPRAMDAALKDMLRKMLDPDPARRLGELDALKRHAWFQSVDWQQVERAGGAPPFRPIFKMDGDRSCFDEYPDVPDEDFGNARAATSPEFRNF